MFEQQDVFAVMDVQEKKASLFINGKEVVSVRPNSSKQFLYDGQEYSFTHSKTFCEVRSGGDEPKYKMVKTYNV
jgi:hypothetical protein